MKFKELKKLIRSGAELEAEIVTHATHSQYGIRIQTGDESHRLLNWRNRPLIFRSLDQARQALAQAGVKQATLIQHVAHDEVIGRVATYDEPHLARIPMSA
ncbi:DUF6482 family protein [Oceanospirillum sanctuarii]|uniref:DUF6482 family protein n=1 Tax=Oceanospirillum sanctuarii TaxID=1434821 RepID=UPI000A3B62E8|nr:DUF6482 family protein [Oceanospirillum sanctuarii]